MYSALKKELVSIISDESNFIANASNFSALIFNSLKDINWAGFYFIDNQELILGPFQGKPACIRIPIGKGVCGYSAKIAKTVVVENVHEFPGHIACDSNSKSEIVTPLIFKNKVYGVFDIDSPVYGRFNENDKEGIEKMLELLLTFSNIEQLKAYYKF